MHAGSNARYMYLQVYSTYCLNNTRTVTFAGQKANQMATQIGIFLRYILSVVLPIAVMHIYISKLARMSLAIPFM